MLFSSLWAYFAVNHFLRKSMLSFPPFRSGSDSTSYMKQTHCQWAKLKLLFLVKSNVWACVTMPNSVWWRTNYRHSIVYYAPEWSMLIIGHFRITFSLSSRWVLVPILSYENQISFKLKNFRGKVSEGCGKVASRDFYPSLKIFQNFAGGRGANSITVLSFHCNLATLHVEQLCSTLRVPSIPPLVLWRVSNSSLVLWKLSDKHFALRLHFSRLMARKTQKATPVSTDDLCAPMLWWNASLASIKVTLHWSFNFFAAPIPP